MLVLFCLVFFVLLVFCVFVLFLCFWFLFCVLVFSFMTGKKSSPPAGLKQSHHDSHSRFRFLLGELIGEKVKVVSSACRSLQGIEGEIVDETLATFLIQTPRGRKRVPKKGSVFLFGTLRVSGEVLACRPEERTKKLFQTLQKTKKLR